MSITASAGVSAELESVHDRYIVPSLQNTHVPRMRQRPQRVLPLQAKFSGLISSFLSAYNKLIKLGLPTLL
jgi:hypothetical protein